MATNSKIIGLEEDDESINLLVYGKSGSGKTVFAGSSDNVLFIAPEDDGTLSAKRFGSKAKKWPVKSWEDIEEAYEWLYDNPDHGFDWIVIDSITEMQQMLLKSILAEVVKQNPSRDPDIPAIQDHQKWQLSFKRFVHAFNDLPVNVLYTALVRNETDEEENSFLTPDVQGKGYQMSQLICSYMTSYGYLQVRRKKDEDGNMQELRRITWRDTGVIQGKDRTGVLAPYTENVTLRELTEWVSKGERKPARKATRKTARKGNKAPATVGADNENEEN